MVNILSKLVKPYLPDPSVEWENLDLSTTREKKIEAQEAREKDAFQLGSSSQAATRCRRPIVDLGQDFADPIVNKEFKVYMNRDIASTVNAVIYGVIPSVCYVVGVMNVEDNKHLWGIISYAASVVLCTTFFLDLYSFVNLVPGLTATGSQSQVECRMRMAHYRHRLKYALLVGMLLCNAWIPTFTLRERNCQKAVDWMAILGIREKWQPSSPQDLLNNCPRALHPYAIFCLTVVAVTATIPTRNILIFQTAFLVVNFTSDIYYPYDHPLSATDLCFRYLMYLVTAMTGALSHAIRWWSSMSQFKQHLILVQETVRATKSEEEVENLLCSILPPSALDRLTRGVPVSDFADEATVLFSDIRGFTAWSSNRSARQVVAMLDVLVVECDDLTVEHGVEKIKTIGDAYWAVAGLPEPCSDHAVRITRFGFAFLKVLDDANRRYSEWEGISVRVGIHSGPLSGGILGTQQLSYEVFGDTNTVAGKVEQQGIPGKICVTEDTMYKLGLDRQNYPLTDEVELVGGTAWERLAEVAQEETWKPIKIYTLTGREDLRSRSSHHHNAPADIVSPELDTVGARRRLFFKLDTTEEEVSEAELEERYNKRRYKIVFPDFADETNERDFIASLRKDRARAFTATRAMMLLVVLIVALALYSSDTPSTVSSIVISFALVISAVDLALCRASFLNSPWYLPKLHAALTSVTCFPLLVACSLGFGASIATGTASAPIFLANCLCLFGNIGLMSAATLTGLFTLHWIVIFSLEWNRFATPITLNGSPLAVIMFGFICWVMERTFRQHYVQFKVAVHFKAQQEDRKKEREVLLRAMVPSHVVDGLMVWMQNGMLVEESIVDTLPQTLVAFLHFEKPTTALHQQIEEAAFNNSSTNSNNFNTLSPRDGRWLIDLHQQVDDILRAEFNQSIIKIKTIGDVAMLGGPFANHNGNADAISTPKAQMFAEQDQLHLGKLKKASIQLMDIIYRIQTEINADFRTGIHVGELVGGVLGTNRLCFDIFGDSVNTASRIMSSGSSIGDISVSREFLNKIDSICVHVSSGLIGQYEHCHGGEEDEEVHLPFLLEYTDPVTVVAKGKGKITVYRLQISERITNEQVPHKSELPLASSPSGTGTTSTNPFNSSSRLM